MLRAISLIIPLFMLSLHTHVKAAEIYTWIDATGKTHYGDQPPTSDMPVRKLNDSAAVSVVGNSALRESERDFLKAAEQAAQELRIAREAAAAERARNRPPQVNVVTVEQPRRAYDNYPILYHRNRYNRHRSHHHRRDAGVRWSLGYNDDRFRVRIGNDRFRHERHKPRTPQKPPARTQPAAKPSFNSAAIPSRARRY